MAIFSYLVHFSPAYMNLFSKGPNNKTKFQYDL